MRRAWKVLTVAFALAAGASGCHKDNQQAAMAGDSAGRNLMLPPSAQTTPALADTSMAATAPAATPTPVSEPVKPAPAKAAPRRASTPAAPSRYTATAGTTLSLAATDAISSRTAKAGDAFTARVDADVKDASGHVVIPAGSTVHGTISEIKPGGASTDGTLKLAVTSVTVRGESYPIQATVASAATVRQGRGVTGKEAAKVGVGAAAGAIVGRIVGKDTKGAVIGGVAGAAAGAGVAAATRTVDVVLPAGAAVKITLDQPLSVPAR